MDRDKIEPRPARDTVLLTGATGFVGRHLYAALVEAGHRVICASRNPDRAAQRFGDRTFRELDIDDPDSVERALEGIDRVVYLVHHLNTGDGYFERETRAARHFVDRADRAGIKRLVYLGGVCPQGTVSKHLKGRLETGRILRSGQTSTVELRAGMVIGPGSASWGMLEDLAARLPAMLLPAWLRFHSQPIFIDDVVVALTTAVSKDDIPGGWYNIPGVDVVTHAQMLRLAADVMGKHPLMFPVPLLSPRLSSYWIATVTRTPLPLAREIVQGLQSDLYGADRDFFDHLPGHQRRGIEEAMRITLQDEALLSSSHAEISSMEERVKSALRKIALASFSGPPS